MVYYYRIKEYTIELFRLLMLLLLVASYMKRQYGTRSVVMVT